MEKQKTGSLASYIILAASLPTVASFPVPATHYMYLRKDSPTVPSPDTPRSIFIANIPIDATEKTLRTFFKQIGGALVERVDFEEDLAKAQVREQGILVKGQRWDDNGAQRHNSNGKKRKREEHGEAVAGSTLPDTWTVKMRKSGENAVVVFVDRATADAVIKECRSLLKKNKTVPWIQVEQLGLDRYKAHHKLTYPPRAELQQSVNLYLAQYAELETARNKKLKQIRSEPDEDGFITVTRGGRSGPARLEEAQAAAERMKEREKKRVGGTFYRFQAREEAKKRERDLKEKFEDDARKLKETRQRKGAVRPE